MIADKNIPAGRLLRWILPDLIKLTLWSSIAVAIFEFGGIQKWLAIPWLPLSLIGIAVAFYLGFKNNSAYDRLWESRKIWGAIVNSSRAWGSAVRSFVSEQFVERVEQGELSAIHKRVIYRHIAWLYALRSQLLMIKPWEHAAQGGRQGRLAMHHRENFGVGLIGDDVTREELGRYLPASEFEAAILAQNTATQLIDKQSLELQALRARDLIDDFRHMELQKILGDFYTHQGKAERIKNYPLPRQYANSGSIFVTIFLLLLPFGIAAEFWRLEVTSWLAVPFSVLVGWLFATMERVGDYSENPFQGMGNDIPMLALCRTIEIDLREMLGETELPPAIRPEQGILM